MKKIAFLLLILVHFSSSCDKNEVDAIAEGELIISNDLFKNAPKDPITISGAKIVGDSLEIKFGASCCDGNNWEISLVGSSDILYSLPPQRQIRLSLKNNEECTAVCGKTIAFDIKPSRIDGGQIILRLEGWQETLSYKY
jgi:hypothetical protein